MDQVTNFIVRNHELTMKWILLPQTDQLQVEEQEQGGVVNTILQVPAPTGAQALDLEELEEEEGAKLPQIKEEEGDRVEDPEE